MRPAPGRRLLSLPRPRGTASVRRAARDECPRGPRPSGRAAARPSRTRKLVQVPNLRGCEDAGDRTKIEARTGGRYPPSAAKSEVACVPHEQTTSSSRTKARQRSAKELADAARLEGSRGTAPDAPGSWVRAMARRRHEVEALARARSERQPVHELLGVRSARSTRSARPRVRLPRDADDVRGTREQSSRDPWPTRTGPLLVAHARSVKAPLARNLQSRSWPGKEPGARRSARCRPRLLRGRERAPRSSRRTSRSVPFGCGTRSASAG